MSASVMPDSLYMLMFPGWKNEFRSNRWHYASRWARHLPVTLVQPWPESERLDSAVEMEPRIPNCSILHVACNPEQGGSFIRGLLQANQILAEMQRRGHTRPILWAYDPDYLEAFSLIPAVLRVYHATENYYQFADASAHFTGRLSGMVGMADMTIAVSDGVAQSYQPASRQPIDVITNGCDYAFFAGGTPDAELAAIGRGFRKTAVYGGNINDRLDLELIERLTSALPDTLFAFFGRVSRFSDKESAIWQGLKLKDNFRHFGSVPVERLPNLYAAAHLGVAPYKLRADLLDNLFPLKIFEMLAAGLPVVSAPFASLADKTAGGLRLAEDDGAFIEAVTCMDRRTLSDAERQQADMMCRAQDYDGKFAAVRQLVESRSRPRPSSPWATTLGLSDAAAVSAWLANVPGALARLEPSTAELIRQLTMIGRRRLEMFAYRNLPAPVRRVIKRALFIR